MATGRPMAPDALQITDHLDLSPDPRSVSVARRFVGERLRDLGWLGDEDRVTLSLLTSELVTNGVLHARTPLRLGVAVGADVVMVSVGDGNRLTPEQQPYSESATGGRGMLLVREMADDWGVEHHRDGKTVWCAMRRPHAATTGSDG